jgi:hypothetical protein
MKNNLKSFIVSCCLISFLSCKKNEVELVDKTTPTETAPTYTADSPMWKKLTSPSNSRYSGGVVKTEVENLYTCVMARVDTLNDHLQIDNFSHISMWGNIDAQTIITGEYVPENNYWVSRKTEGTPRYSPILLGPFAITGRFGIINYFTLLGSGYSVDENYPAGFKFIKDWWLQSDYNQTGDIVNEAILTGFMANNAGYFLENDNKKQVWFINNGQIYEKRKPFSGNFLGRFTTTSAKINGKDYGYMLSESQDEKINSNNFYQYNTETDTWLRKANFPGEDRYEGVIFGINDKVYYGLGQSKTEAKGFRDIWQYDPQTDKWNNFAIYPGSGNIKVSTALVSGKVYIGMGYYVGKTAINTEKYIGVSDFWEFVPSKK